MNEKNICDENGLIFQFYWGNINDPKLVILGKNPSLRKKPDKKNRSDLIDNQGYSPELTYNLEITNKEARKEKGINTYLFTSKMKEEGFLFTKEDGDIMNPNTFMYWLEKILDKAELPHFTIHSLRHTNITLQILSGVPLVTVAGRAGHSRTSTTSDVYSHYVQSSDKGAAVLLEKRFEENKKEEVNEEQEILKLKKEAKENGFNNIKEYLDYLKQLAH